MRKAFTVYVHVCLLHRTTQWKGRGGEGGEREVEREGEGGRRGGRAYTCTCSSYRIHAVYGMHKHPVIDSEAYNCILMLKVRNNCVCGSLM